MPNVPLVKTFVPNLTTTQSREKVEGNPGKERGKEKWQKLTPGPLVSGVKFGGVLTASRFSHQTSDHMETTPDFVALTVTRSSTEDALLASTHVVDLDFITALQRTANTTTTRPAPESVVNSILGKVSSNGNHLCIVITLPGNASSMWTILITNKNVVSNTIMPRLSTPSITGACPEQRAETIFDWMISKRGPTLSEIAHQCVSFSALTGRVAHRRVSCTSLTRISWTTLTGEAKKRRTPKKKRDPNKPQGYISAFNFWVRDVRPKMLALYPQLKSVQNNAVNRILGDTWVSLVHQKACNGALMASKITQNAPGLVHIA